MHLLFMEYNVCKLQALLSWNIVKRDLEAVHNFAKVIGRAHACRSALVKFEFTGKWMLEILLYHQISNFAMDTYPCYLWLVEHDTPRNIGDSLVYEIKILQRCGLIWLTLVYSMNCQFIMANYLSDYKTIRPQNYKR